MELLKGRNKTASKLIVLVPNSLIKAGVAYIDTIGHKLGQRTRPIVRQSELIGLGTKVHSGLTVAL